MLRESTGTFEVMMSGGIQRGNGDIFSGRFLSVQNVLDYCEQELG